MSVTDWSPRPSGNAVADRTIPARDGMAGREFPIAIRGVMAQVAAYALDQNGALQTGGVDNGYTLTTNSGLTELKPGASFSFVADRENNSAPTLNVDGLGPRPLLTPSGLPLPASAVKQGLFYTVIWVDAIGPFPAGWRLKGAAAVLNGNDFATLGHTPVNDRDYAVVAGDVQVGMVALTAPRTIYLPDVDTFPLGQDLVVADESGACSDTLTITVLAGIGTGDIIGTPEGNSILFSAYQAVRFRRGAANLWIRL